MLYEKFKTVEVHYVNTCSNLLTKSNDINKYVYIYGSLEPPPLIVILLIYDTLLVRDKS